MPSNFQALANALLTRAASNSDPAMISLLQAVIQELEKHDIELFPPQELAGKITTQTSPPPQTPTDFEYELTNRNVILRWTPLGDISYFELRKGVTWDTATRILITGERQVILDPLEEGDHTFLLRSLSYDGVYSSTTLSVVVSIPNIGAPSLTSQTIDQNVLLFWTAPTSTFLIDHYVVEREGVEIGKFNGTFATYIELISGTYEYGVYAVDIAGNIGDTGIISTTVAGPPDFILRNDFQSDLSGTKVNARIESYDNTLLLPIDLTETWANHFINNGWATPQDQVDDGYPLYIQPGTITASYKEVFDTGVIYPATIISITWSVSVLAGAFTIGVSTRVSDDGVSWSAPQVGQNIFVESVRYVEVTVNFTGADDTAILKFFNFRVFVNVKESVDSGTVSAISTDVGGTFVAFNLDFKDVDSITLAAESTTGPFTPLYDFNDVPNPTGFSVYVFNSAGARVSKEVSWKARGII